MAILTEKQISIQELYVALNKYENALVEILNGIDNYDLYPIEVNNKTKYILFIPTGFDEGIDIEISEETYNVLVELDKEINDIEEE